MVQWQGGHDRSFLRLSTTQFGLATTGVKGLRPSSPWLSIASWYEYTNSQGISTRSNTAYSDSWPGCVLAGTWTRRIGPPSRRSTATTLNQIRNDQKASNGDYSDHWAVRDYTLNAENIQCPALIVHGLNDYNVRTKEFDLMYQAYERPGSPPRSSSTRTATSPPPIPPGPLLPHRGGVL